MRFFLIKVIFSGVRGNGVFGDIAVDDISLAPGACGGLNLVKSFHFRKLQNRCLLFSNLSKYSKYIE